MLIVWFSNQRGWFDALTYSIPQILAIVEFYLLWRVNGVSHERLRERLFPFKYQVKPTKLIYYMCDLQAFLLIAIYPFNLCIKNL